VLAPRASAPTLEELKDHVTASLDRTAAPREVHVVDELPMIAIGKVNRAALRRRFTSP
jgi:O-succinylbenzoic acid--CoA ligase